MSSFSYQTESFLLFLLSPESSLIGVCKSRPWPTLRIKAPRRQSALICDPSPPSLWVCVSNHALTLSSSAPKSISLFHCCLLHAHLIKDGLSWLLSVTFDLLQGCISCSYNHSLSTNGYVWIQNGAISQNVGCKNTTLDWVYIPNVITVHQLLYYCKLYIRVLRHLVHFWTPCWWELLEHKCTGGTGTPSTSSGVEILSWLS